MNKLDDFLRSKIDQASINSPSNWEALNQAIPKKTTSGIAKWAFALLLLGGLGTSVFLLKNNNNIVSSTSSNTPIKSADNNSTDLTTNIVDKYSYDKRLKYFKNETNLGATNNHNKALQYITGKYVAMFSDDDIMLQSSLKKRIEVLDNNNDVVLVHSSLSTIDENNLLIQKGHWAKDIYNDFKIDTGFMNNGFLKSVLINKWNFISMPTVMLKAEVLSQNCLIFNPALKYSIDWDLWLNLSEYGKFYYINEELVHYRKHSNNETNRISPDIALSELVLMKLSYYYKYKSNELNENFIDDVLRECALQINEAYGLKSLKKHWIKVIFDKYFCN